MNATIELTSNAEVVETFIAGRVAVPLLEVSRRFFPQQNDAATYTAVRDGLFPMRTVRLSTPNGGRTRRLWVSADEIRRFVREIDDPSAA